MLNTEKCDFDRVLWTKNLTRTCLILFFYQRILRLAWEAVDKKDLATSMLVSQKCVRKVQVKLFP